MRDIQDIDEIVSGCLQNDRKSQHRLYEAFASSMLGLCMRYTRSKQEAEDIMIEGFVHVFKKLRTFRQECSLESWIRTIMINAALDAYRSNKKHLLDISIEESTTAAPSNASHENIVTRLEVKQILELMDEMPEDQRIIFNLFAIEGYPFKDIAQMLDRNENTVRVYFQRARLWLQKRIQVEEHKK